MRNEQDPNAVSPVLKQTVLPVQNDTLCARSTTYKVDDRVTFCAGDAQGNSDSCKGDSGGPFMRLEMKDKKKKWTVAGIVSWGEGCAMNNTYGYYTRLTPFVDWIRRTTSLAAGKIYQRLNMRK